jgi:hypothetical protein
MKIESSNKDPSTGEPAIRIMVHYIFDIYTYWKQDMLPFRPRKMGCLRRRLLLRRALKLPIRSRRLVSCPLESRRDPALYFAEQTVFAPGAILYPIENICPGIAVVITFTCVPFSRELVVARTLKQGIGGERTHCLASVPDSSASNAEVLLLDTGTD